MSTSRTKPFPVSNPHRLAEIARESGQSVEQLRAQIADRARLAAQPGHLRFDALKQGQFSEEEQHHLDSCVICQDLYEAMNETLTTEAVQAWLDRAAIPTTVEGAPPGGGDADSRLVYMALPIGWRIAAGLVTFLAVGTIAFLVFKDRASAPSLMAAMTTETRFSVARDLAAAGEYPQANGVLVSAFERSEIEKPIVHSVRTVLETKPATDPATIEIAREQISRLIKQVAATNERVGSSKIEPHQALELSGLQMRSGATRASYETLGTYLKLVDGSSPTTAAYEERFVQELPSAGDSKVAAQEAADPRS